MESISITDNSKASIEFAHLFSNHFCGVLQGDL